MKRLQIATVALLAAALAGCDRTGSGSGSPGGGRDQVVITRRVLDEAASLAREYGRRHLGHFLNLSVRDLESEGLDVPRGIEVDIDSTHSTFCIRIRNDALPETNVWQTVTAGSGANRPGPSDDCA